jgi:hypothetical protein
VRRIGQLAAAAEAGYRIGRARRQTGPEDFYRFTSERLRDAFWRGYRRGRAATAKIEQTRLELEVSA